MVALIGLVALAGLGWLIWAATVHSQPAVTGHVSGYRVISATETEVTLTVDRPDPSMAASCLVYVQATNFERVGEIEVEVPSSQHELVDITVKIKTLREGTSASVDSCRQAV